MKFLLICSSILFAFVLIFYNQKPASEEQHSHWEITTKASHQKGHTQQIQDSLPDDVQLKENTVDENIKKREHIVSNKLNRFLEETASITAHSIAKERENITRALRENYSRQEKMPTSAYIIDEHGDKWEMLKFGNGMVRYIPLSEGEKKI